VLRRCTVSTFVLEMKTVLFFSFSLCKEAPCLRARVKPCMKRWEMRHSEQNRRIPALPLQPSRCCSFCRSYENKRSGLKFECSRSRFFNAHPSHSSAPVALDPPLLVHSNTTLSDFKFFKPSVPSLRPPPLPSRWRSTRGAVFLKSS